MTHRNLFAFILGIALAITGAAYAASQAQPSLASLSGAYLANTERSCLFPPGGWAIVDCSAAAAATSSALNPWSRYVVQCLSDSYVAIGDEATDAADANDGYLPTGAWLEFLTDGTGLYFTCLNRADDTDCRLMECR